MSDENDVVDSVDLTVDDYADMYNHLVVSQSEAWNKVDDYLLQYGVTGLG